MCTRENRQVGEKRKNSVVGFPKVESMILIADFFGVDVGYLLGETDEETFTMEKAEKYLALNKEAIQAIMDITRPNSSGPLALEMRKSINYLLSSKYFKIWFETLDDIFQHSCVSEDDIKNFDRLDDAIDYVVGKNETLKFLRYSAFESFLQLIDNLYPYYKETNFFNSDDIE